jgi:hypothetical protein
MTLKRVIRVSLLCACRTGGSGPAFQKKTGWDPLWVSDPRLQSPLEVTLPGSAP